MEHEKQARGTILLLSCFWKGPLEKVLVDTVTDHLRPVHAFSTWFFTFTEFEKRERRHVLCFPGLNVMCYCVFQAVTKCVL